MPVINADPHLVPSVSDGPGAAAAAPAARRERDRNRLTFLNVLSPARMLPPIQVLYLRSGGAKILMRMSRTANFCTSASSRSPKPLVSVLPPDSTMLLKSALRRSRSVRPMASTTIWCTPGYSSPIISGSKRISGARNRSWLICSTRHREHWT